jgi:hypothetical protein
MPVCAMRTTSTHACAQVCGRCEVDAPLDHRNRQPAFRCIIWAVQQLHDVIAD